MLVAPEGWINHVQWKELVDFLKWYNGEYAVRLSELENNLHRARGDKFREGLKSLIEATNELIRLEQERDQVSWEKWKFFVALCPTEPKLEKECKKFAEKLCRHVRFMES